jgi:BMFP domain-containing protein YqiC
LIELKKLEDIVENVTKVLPGGSEHVRAEVRDNVRLILQSAFSRMNLVTREEFDAQSLLLVRTREKLDKLERVVRKMED